MVLHAGRLVVSRIGTGRAAARTVIGPAVNVASWLAKARGAELALSRATADWSGLDVSDTRSKRRIRAV